LYKIIGVGEAVKDVIAAFDKYPEYKTYYFNESDLGDYSSMQEYEENFPVSRVRKNLKTVTKNCEALFVVQGGAPVVGASLRMLEVLKRAKVSILYLSPDTTLLNQKEKEWAEFSSATFQDIVRSGWLEKLLMVDLEIMESVIGEVSLSDYDRAVAENVVGTFAMLNYFDHTDPVKSTKNKLPAAVRIGTFGLLSDDGEEVLFYDLQNIKDREYCYGIPIKETKSGIFLKKIKKQIKDNLGKSRCCFSVYAIKSEKHQGYVRAFTDICQSSGGTNDNLAT